MSTPSRIGNPLLPRRHAKAVAWVNALILDLKLQLIGRSPHSPVTLERLDEWHKHHFHDVHDCIQGRLP